MEKLQREVEIRSSNGYGKKNLPIVNFMFIMICSMIMVIVAYALWHQPQQLNKNQYVMGLMMDNNYQVVLDQSSNQLFVYDSFNNRVLIYNDVYDDTGSWDLENGRRADYVIGDINYQDKSYNTYYSLYKSLDSVGQSGDNLIELKFGPPVQLDMNIFSEDIYEIPSRRVLVWDDDNVFCFYEPSGANCSVEEYNELIDHPADYR